MKIAYSSIVFCAILIFVLTLARCGDSSGKPEATDPSRGGDPLVTGNFSSQSALTFDSLQITRFFKQYPGVKEYENDVRHFYRGRGFTYAWFDEGLLIEQAGNLANRILNLEDEGVFKKLLYREALDSLMHGVNTASEPGEADITLELLLTSEYFVYSRLAWNGMSQDVSRSAKWYLPRKKISYESYLDSLLKSPVKAKQVNEPVYRQYELLRAQLGKYRLLASAGNWEPLLLTGGQDKIGSTSVFTTQLKARLFRLGDFKGDTLNQVFNPQLTDALTNFQRRNGLPETGKIDKETLTALNAPLSNKIRQIIVNMERSRWLPVEVAGDYVAVNIPEFKLHVYHGDSLLWSCDAVVGKTNHPTTLFYGEIKYIVFSPYWNIPPGILRNEVIPGMRKSSSYLARHNMEVTGYSNGLPVVRQKPGPSNSLGLVKFLFPNSYNIYLHDTPSKSLFNETSRAFSHGCIRIQEPAKLAAFLLKDRQEWNPTTIANAMNAGKERYVTLENKVPVFISYFTAFVDRDNQLNFRKDIYNLDARLAAMIIAGEK